MGYKEKTQEVLFRYYNQKGCEQVVKAAHKMMESKHHKDNVNFATTLHGEICETVLEILIKDYIAKNKEKTLGWSCHRSLILKNRERLKRDFSTEIDLTLFTPKCIYLFECKSYSGDKVLTDDGLLTRTNGYGESLQCNVFKQSVIHKETIMSWVQDFVLDGRTPLIQMCMFDFSKGTLTDKRTKTARAELPCLNEHNVIEYLTRPGEIVWNAKCLEIAGVKLEKVSASLQLQHLEYVKQLHGGGRN